jgi:O-antigen/teichoic acid export membrane protein
MRKELLSTAKHTAVYSIGNLSTKLIGLVLLPLYTARLTVDNYGRFAILEVTMQFLIMICGMKLVSGMFRWCSDTDDSHEQGRIIFSSYITMVVLAVALNLLFQPLRGTWSRLFFGSADSAFLFSLIFINVGLEIVNSIPMNVLRFRQKSLLYVVLFSIKLATALGLNVYFIAFAGKGIDGILLSHICANGLFLVLSIPIMLQNSVPKFNVIALTELLHYSLPLVVSAISVQLLTMGDRFILKYFLAYEDVALYSLAFKIAGVINVFIIQSFTLSFLPIAYRMSTRQDGKQFFIRIHTYFIGMLVIAALLLSLFSREVLMIFARNQAYYTAALFVPLLSLTFVFKGMQYLYSLAFHYVKKTRYNAVIVFGGVALNFLLNFILIPRYGIWGAAIATVISSMSLAAAFYIVSQSFYAVRYKVGTIGGMLVLAVAVLLLSIRMQVASPYLSILIKLSLALLYGVLLFVLRIFSFRELKRLISVVRNR